MSIIDPGYFDKDGRHRKLDAGYFVYTAFCPARDGVVPAGVGNEKAPPGGRASGVTLGVLKSSQFSGREVKRLSLLLRLPLIPMPKV